MEPLHWHLLGAGAIGSLWAMALQRAGHQVTLILRDESALQRFHAGGRQLSIEDGSNQHCLTFHAVTAADVTQIDHLLVTLKAYAVEPAVQALQNKLSPQAQVVLLQNGMGPQQRLANQLTQPVWAATTTHGAWVRAPFEVVWAGKGTTHIGPLNHSQPLPDSFHAELLPVLVATDAILDLLWRKLAINCAINPLTAILNVNNGALVEVPELRQRFQALCEEIDAVLIDQGRQHLFPKGLFDTAGQVAQQTGSNRSSMLQDLSQRRTTEIDQITGYLLEIARTHMIAMPICQDLLNNIKQTQST